MLIAGIGLALRLVPLFAQLPYGIHPDEPRNMNASAAMVTETTLGYGSLAGHVSYPGLMYNLGAGTFWLWSTAADVTGVEDEAPNAQPFVDNIPANVRSEHPGAVVALRIPIVLLSAATIVTASAAAWLITRRRSATLLAGAFVAFSAVDIEIGSTFTPDPIGAALAAATLLATVLILRRPSLGPHVLAGALVGLATAAKYNLVLVAMAVLSAYLIVAWGQLRQRLHWLAAAAATSLAAYVIASPNTFLHWDAAWEWFKLEQEHYRRGHPGYEGDAPRFYAQTLFRMFGPALLLVPAAVMARPAIRRFLIPIAAYTVVYVVAVSTYETRFERFMTAVTPAIAVLAAVGGQALVDRIRSGPPSWRPAAAVLAVVALALPVATSTVAVVAAEQDPRGAARAWVEEHVSPGTRIGVDAYAAWIDPERYEVQPMSVFGPRPYRFYRELGIRYFVVAESQLSRWNPAKRPDAADAYRDLLDATCAAATFDSHNDTIMILTVPPC